MASDPLSSEPLALDREAREIREKIFRTKRGHEIDLRTRWAVRAGDLQQAFLDVDPDVVHFSGHGTEAGKIVLHRADSPEVGLLSADALAELFRVLKGNIRLVVLNACFTEHQASAIAEHIDCVVGMSRQISDEVATVFSAALYRGLASEKSIQTAFDMGLAELGLVGFESEQSIPRLLTRSGIDAGSCFHRRRRNATYVCQAPPPDADFVQRQQLEPMVEQLVQGAEGAGIFALTTALRGAGGFGKTTLALALCRDPRVRETYPDGILWIVVGENPSDGERIRAIREMLTAWTGETVPVFETVDGAGQHLRKILSGARVLVVVDDVWRRKDLRPFEGLERGAALLTTTRIRDALPVNARTIDVDQMEADESVQLLFKGLGGEADSEDIEKLAERLGRWPLLIKLVNAQLRKLTSDGLDLGPALERIERGFDKRGLTAFDQTDEEERERAVDATMGAAFAARLLSESDEQRYRSLAAFPENTDIPIGALAPFWDLDRNEAEAVCRRLRDVSLVLGLDLHRSTVRLHDVVRKYLIDSTVDLPALQAQFLKAHRPTSSDWSELPEDQEYLWLHLAYHLKEADHFEKLDDLLIDPAYLKAKLQATDINSLLSDFEDRDAERLLIADALRKSASCLNVDSHQLPAQLIGRLGEAEEPLLASFVARLQREPELLPTRGSLMPAGGPLKQTLKEHTQRVNAVDTLGEGGLVSASSDSTLRVWDSESGRCLHTLEGHTQRVNAVATLEGGRLVSASYDSTLRVWDSESGRCLHTLEGHTKSVNAVAVLEGGQLVSASSDSTLRVWDPESGRCLYTLEGHTHWVLAVAALAGGHLASASYDSTLRVWDPESGRCLHTLEGHTHWVLAVVALAGGYLASGSSDSTLRVWDMETGRCLHTLEGHTDWVRALTALGSGRLASASDDSTMRVWDIESGRCLHTLEGHTHWVRAVAALEGGRLASASYDSTLRVWDPESGRCLHTLEGHTNPVLAVVSSGDGRLVSVSDDSTLRVWDPESRRCLHTLEGHTQGVNAVLTLEGGRIVSASRDSTLRVWDTESGRCLRTLKGHTQGVNAVVSLKGGRIVSASKDSTLRVWDTKSGRCLHLFKGHTNSVIAAVALKGEQIVSASYDCTLRVWDTKSNRCLCTLKGHTDWALAVAALEGGRLVSASYDSTLRVWDIKSGRCLHTLEGHKQGVNTVAILEGERLISASYDSTLRVWDPKRGRCLKTLEGHTDSVNAMATLGKGRIISASGDSTLRVWDIGSGRCLHTLEGHQDSVNAVATLGRGRLVSASHDSTLRVWDTESGEILACFTADGPVVSLLALGPSGPFVAGESSGRLHILKWNVETHSVAPL